jgi:hypothetical protein
MASKSKIGIALALMVLVVATAPAVLCVRYLATQSQAQDHSCCPQKTSPVSTVVPTCCIHSPAVTSHGIDVPAQILAGAAFTVEPLSIIAANEAPDDPDLDTSPPLCNSILRI